VFSGEPDVGKGMTTVDLAARLTRHLDFPDGKNELDGPKDVVFLSSEDDMEDTIVPRLIVAGAVMSRIHFAQISENSTGTLAEGIVCLDRDLPILEEMIQTAASTIYSFILS
jgi:putative DNA primase/helicase